MKSKLLKYKNEIGIFSFVTILYFAITMIFYNKTTIFYDPNNVCDILLDTDTGVLFNWNTFALYQDNSKHLLFMQIVSLLAYPIHSLCVSIAESTGMAFNHVYGLGLIILQIAISATSITLVFNTIKSLKIKKTTLAIIMGIMILSFPQIFMTINVERFIYGQLSLVAFVFIANKLKNKNSYLVDLVAIPLFGITLTNIYLYFINLILEFKFNIKKILKHVGVFALATYVIIVSTRAYTSFMLVGETIQKDTKFIQVIPIIDKIKMSLVRLIYPTMYFPSANFENNLYLQSGSVNAIFLILAVLVLIAAIIGGIKHYKEKIPQLCLGIIGFNLFLHGVIGYNLKNANIMAIHFSFAIVILLAYFAQLIPKQYIKIFNIVLLVVLGTMIITHLQGFGDIMEIGMKYFPK